LLTTFPILTIYFHSCCNLILSTNILHEQIIHQIY